MVLTLSNTLSFIRAPLALLFLQSDPRLRLVAIILAMISDSVDGYLARRSRSTSRLGAILDPATDKFFVLFALVTLCLEGQLTFLQMLAMLARDFFVCLYAISMCLMGRKKEIVFRSIRWGKVTTALQFIVLIGLVLHISFSWTIYGIFVIMGWFAWGELVASSRKTSVV